MNNAKSVFLTAEWRKLIMANYQVDPSILSSFLPAKTELDLWKNKCYVSLVGFMFKKVKLKGIAVPFHTQFPEVNLRFYVKHKVGSIWKRGVVFVSEIVPKPAIAWVANTLFKEHYTACPMKTQFIKSETSINIGYKWKKKGWNNIEVFGSNISVPLVAGSNEEFITEHFWGYARKNKLDTVEYHVEHPRWDIYTINTYNIRCDFSFYGQQFRFLNQQEPETVFLAEGSPVKIFNKRII